MSDGKTPNVWPPLTTCMHTRHKCAHAYTTNTITTTTTNNKIIFRCNWKLERVKEPPLPYGVPSLWSAKDHVCPVCTSVGACCTMSHSPAARQASDLSSLGPVDMPLPVCCPLPHQLLSTGPVPDTHPHTSNMSPLHGLPFCC